MVEKYIKFKDIDERGRFVFTMMLVMENDTIRVLRPIMKSEQRGWEFEWYRCYPLSVLLNSRVAAVVNVGLIRNKGILCSVKIEKRLTEKEKQEVLNHLTKRYWCTITNVDEVEFTPEYWESFK